jgi:DNA uptake protein ComE-like DNA-binding protein
MSWNFAKNKYEAGLVLVTVLWVQIVLTLIVTVVAHNALLDVKISRGVVGEQIRCKWASRAGVETVIGLLAEDERASDSFNDVWADSPADMNSVALDGCLFSAEVVDETSKLNINTATKEQLLWIPDMTEEIADSILDWRDGDDEIRPGGAEVGYYFNMPYGYMIRNGQFKTVRELLLVKDITAGLLYGKSSDEYVSEYNEGWINYLTCYSYCENTDAEGNARVNINTADENKLSQALSIKRPQAKWIIENRSYQTIADLIAKQGQGGGGGNQQSSQGQNQRGGGNSQQQQQSEPLDLNTLYTIADKITVTDDKTIIGLVNVNTASLTVLTALFEGDEQLGLDVISYREGLESGIESLGQLYEIKSMTADKAKKYIDKVTTRSNIYFVRSTGSSELTQAVCKVEAVVDRGDEETAAKILYYCAGAKY